VNQIPATGSLAEASGLAFRLMDKSDIDREYWFFVQYSTNYDIALKVMNWL
jgi:hypothetical protein